MLRWKRPYRDWRPWVLYPLAVALLGEIAFGILTDTPPPPAFADVIVVLAAVAVWRIPQVGVLLRGDQIKVRTMTRTRILHWDDVADVSDGRGGTGGAGLTFVLKSGEQLKTQVRPFSSDPGAVSLSGRQFQLTLERLRERLAATYST